MAKRKNDRPGVPAREKDYSPFTPGNPVPVELFVGRSAQITELRRYARQAAAGRMENVFLSGERGIGKSSLAQFIRELCSKDCNLLGVHVFLGGVSTVEELVQQVFDQLLKETHQQPWFGPIKSLFGKFIRSVGLFGVSVEFAPPREELRSLARHFPVALKSLIEGIGPEKKGLLLVLDDVNGLVDTPAFANWYKSLVDHVATHQREFLVMAVVCGLPERRDGLAVHQPSLMRIFRVVEIEKLDDAEVQDFLATAFASANLRVSEDAMEAMVHYSSGLPTLMHEIGDATFWADSDGAIGLRDALAGITAAAEEVGKKYLDPKVYRAIRSEKYRAILGKLGGRAAEENFRKSDVDRRLNSDEKKVFHNFLRRMRDLGVIESDPERGRGAYRFVNRIFPIYIYMKGRAGAER